jgi:chromosome partitioning protein
MADDLEPFLEIADVVLVPVLPSAIDIEATVPFLNTLAQVPRIKKGKLPVGLVANRVKAWTSVSQQAIEQLQSWPYPLVAQLRDSQAYVLLAALGRCVDDYRSEQMRGHQDDFAAIYRWIKKHT